MAVHGGVGRSTPWWRSTTRACWSRPPLAAERLGLSTTRPTPWPRPATRPRCGRALAAAGVPQPVRDRTRRSERRAGGGRRRGRASLRREAASLSASRGVIRADDRGRGCGAARVRAILAEAGEDPDGPLLVEGFVPGAEVAVEGLLRAGELEVLAVFDKPDPLDGPFFEETIYVTPSRLARREIAAAADRARPRRRRARSGSSTARSTPSCASSDGAAPSVIEVAARTIGGLCARTLALRRRDRALEEVILRHALGLPLDDLRREAAASGVMMLPIPRAGMLAAVRRPGRGARRPGRHRRSRSRSPRTAASRPLPEGDRYLGFVFARGETPAQVEDALRRRTRGSTSHRRAPRPATVADRGGTDSAPEACTSCSSPPTSSATSRCTWRRRPRRCVSRGHEVRCRRPRRRALGAGALAWADTVAVLGAHAHRHAPGVRARAGVRRARPELAGLLYGLYAGLTAPTVGAVADRAIAGEYEPALVAWVDGWRPRRPTRHRPTAVVQLGRGASAAGTRPAAAARRATPASRIGGERAPRRATSRPATAAPTGAGTARCPSSTTGASASSARTPSLRRRRAARRAGRPPHHLRRPRLPQRPPPRAARRAACTRAFPDAHLRRHRQGRAHPAPRRRCGRARRGRAACSWSPPSSRSTTTSSSGSTRATPRADAARAVARAARRGHRACGRRCCPSRRGRRSTTCVDLLDFVAEHDLVGNVDPVQYTIRLLVPAGFAAARAPRHAPHLGRLRRGAAQLQVDPDRPRQRPPPGPPRGTRRAERGGLRADPETFAKVRAAALRAAGRSPSPAGRAEPILAGSTEGRPRLTEPWFC